MFLFILFLLGGCSSTEKPINTVGELSYEYTEDCIVYIEENEEYIPYIVVTNNYNGNTLLLRQEALIEELAFSTDIDDDDDYYVDSRIDMYLNTVYYDSLSDYLKQIIIESDIEITQNYPNLFETEKISRKIFILSATEVGIDSSVVNTEGVPLEYFYISENRLCNKDDVPISWWLRSNYLADRSLVWCIGSDGILGGDGVQYTHGIRPVFCISSDTSVVLKQIDTDLEIYIIE